MMTNISTNLLVQPYNRRNPCKRLIRNVIGQLQGFSHESTPLDQSWHDNCISKNHANPHGTDIALQDSCQPSSSRFRSRLGQSLNFLFGTTKVDGQVGNIKWGLYPSEKFNAFRCLTSIIIGIYIILYLMLAPTVVMAQYYDRYEDMPCVVQEVGPNGAYSYLDYRCAFGLSWRVLPVADGTTYWFPRGEENYQRDVVGELLPDSIPADTHERVLNAGSFTKYRNWIACGHTVDYYAEMLADSCGCR